MMTAPDHATGTATPLGTLRIATVAAVSGLQFLLAFVGYDIASVPRRALHLTLQPPARHTW